MFQKYFIALCLLLFSTSSCLAQISLQMPFDTGQWWGPATYDGHLTGWGTGREKCIDWWFIQNQTDNQPGPEERPQWRQGVSLGKTVRASHSGWVVRKSEGGSYGRYAVIRSEQNSDYLTLYAHMNNYDACPEVGQYVSGGTVIGTVGSTGNAGNAPHLHFELLKENTSGSKTNGSWTSQSLPSTLMDNQAIDFLGWSCTEPITGGFRYQGRPMKSDHQNSGGGTSGEVYVDPSQPNDSGNGSRSSPVQTIKRALEIVSAGGTIFLKGGTHGRPSGQVTKRVTFKSYDGVAHVQ